MNRVSSQLVEIALEYHAYFWGNFLGIIILYLDLTLIMIYKIIFERSLNSNTMAP